MQIVNYLRANLLHSSDAAFNLAMKNNEYLPFAEKLIAVKNEHAHCDLIKTFSDPKKYVLTNSKIEKYERFLKQLSDIQAQAKAESDILAYNNHLPRLNVIERNSNQHEYFLPYNNQPGNITIIAAKESFI